MHLKCHVMCLHFKNKHSFEEVIYIIYDLGMKIYIYFKHLKLKIIFNFRVLLMKGPKFSVLKCRDHISTQAKYTSEKHFQFT